MQSLLKHTVGKPARKLVAFKKERVKERGVKASNFPPLCIMSLKESRCYQDDIDVLFCFVNNRKDQRHKIMEIS